MIEKVVIRDSFKSDLFTQLVGEEMIFQRIIDSTNLKQDVEGGGWPIVFNIERVGAKWFWAEQLRGRVRWWDDKDVVAPC